MCVAFEQRLVSKNGKIIGFFGQHPTTNINFLVEPQRARDVSKMFCQCTQIQN